MKRNKKCQFLENEHSVKRKHRVYVNSEKHSAKVVELGILAALA
jgi:hypothetical protein